MTAPRPVLAAPYPEIRDHDQVQDFERCYAEHAQPLLRFLIFRTGDRALAEDIVADTFVRVLRSRKRFNPARSREKTWIYAIAINVLRDHVRREGVATRAHELTAATARGTYSADPSGSVEDRDLIRHGLEGLTQEEREAIALRYGADLTLVEIAKATKERLSTIEGRVYRALRKLRAELESQAPT